jgi:hypothetical protein
MAYATGGNVRTRQATVSAQNMFTDWVRVEGRGAPASFTASLVDNSTTLNVVWTVQARRVLSDGTSGGVTDIYVSSAASSGGVQTASIVGVWDIRVGVKTGNYTAGTGVAAIDW